jgi:hypothetical protein
MSKSINKGRHNGDDKGVVPDRIGKQKFNTFTTQSSTGPTRNFHATRNSFSLSLYFYRSILSVFLLLVFWNSQLNSNAPRDEYPITDQEEDLVDNIKMFGIYTGMKVKSKDCFKFSSQLTEIIAIL